jgi:hypothetical protein
VCDSVLETRQQSFEGEHDWAGKDVDLGIGTIEGENGEAVSYVEVEVRRVRVHRRPLEKKAAP